MKTASILLIALLTGCNAVTLRPAPTPFHDPEVEVHVTGAPRLTIAELEAYKVSCTNAKDQVTFLKAQKVYKEQKYTYGDDSSMQQTSAAMKNGKYNAILNDKIRQAETFANLEKQDPERKLHTCPEDFSLR